MDKISEQTKSFGCGCVGVWVCVGGGVGGARVLTCGRPNKLQIALSLLKIFIATQTLFFIPFINYVSNHLNIWRGLSWCIAVAALWWCGQAQSSWTWHAASRTGKANEEKRKGEKKKKKSSSRASQFGDGLKSCWLKMTLEKWAWEWVKERERGLDEEAKTV